MLSYASTPAELTCIIGHLFNGLEPPCEGCAGAGGLTLRGTAYSGERVTVTLTPWGFDFEGDGALIERIREGRCRYERPTAEPTAANHTGGEE